MIASDRSPGGAGRRWGLSAAFAVLLVLLAPLRPAVADDDLYTATVTVDATSDTVAKARDVARVDGARKALNAVIDKLSGGASKAKPLKLSDNQVTDMVASFEVANEKMTAVRYIADYTYHFRKADVTKAMQAAGISTADANANGNPGGAPPNPAQPPTPPISGGKPVVVLPIYQGGADAVLWDDPNPWRLAWSQRPAPAGGSNLMVPLGDIEDVAAIDAEKARAGDADALAGIAKKEGADDVLVAVATQRASPAKAGLDVTVKRYHAGQFVDVHTDAIDVNPGEQEAALMRRAADTIAADIDNGWKNAKGASPGQQGSIVVVAPVSGLDDWLKLRDSLATLPSVRKVDVKSLSRQEATVEISYVGTLDQLKANLAAIKLGLEGGDPVWRLARADAG